jgi:hypothetical protein
MLRFKEQIAGASRILEKRLASSCEAGPSTRAIKKENAQVFLQSLDLLAYGRLREV